MCWSIFHISSRNCTFLGISVNRLFLVSPNNVCIQCIQYSIIENVNMTQRFLWSVPNRTKIITDFLIFPTIYCCTLTCKCTCDTSLFFTLYEPLRFRFLLHFTCESVVVSLNRCIVLVFQLICDVWLVVLFFGWWMVSKHQWKK